MTGSIVMKLFLTMTTGIILMPPSPVATAPAITNSGTVQHAYVLIGASAQQKEVLTYMQQVSAGNIDFILTMFAESGFNPIAKSKTHDSGICQRHIPAHPEHAGVLNDSIPKQVDDCRAKRKLVPNKGRYRYGYNVRMKYKNRFIF